MFLKNVGLFFVVIVGTAQMSASEITISTGNEAQIEDPTVRLSFVDEKKVEIDTLKVSLKTFPSLNSFIDDAKALKTWDEEQGLVLEAALYPRAYAPE
jgi:hypothetical protein